MNTKRTLVAMINIKRTPFGSFLLRPNAPFGCRGGGGSGDVMVVLGDDDVVFGGWVAEEPIYIKRTLRCLPETNRTYFCDEVVVMECGAAVAAGWGEKAARGREWWWGSGRSGGEKCFWSRPESSPENFSGGGWPEKVAAGGCSLNVCGAVLALFGSFPGFGQN
ncbi:hypothetical protein Tco_0827335 [Tanacetum coccineum]